MIERSLDRVTAPLRAQVFEIIEEINAAAEPYRPQVAAVNELAAAELEPFETALAGAEARCHRPLDAAVAAAGIVVALGLRPVGQG